MDFEDNIVKLLNDEFAKRTYLNDKYTEVQFAKDIGINKDSMHAYLNKKRIPNADSLVKISNGLNISVDYLLGLSKTKHIEPTEEDKAILKVSELTGLKCETIERLFHANKTCEKFIKENNINFEYDDYTGMPNYEKLFEKLYDKQGEKSYENDETIEFLSLISFLNAYTCSTVSNLFNSLHNYLTVGNGWYNDIERNYFVQAFKKNSNNKKTQAIESYKVDPDIIKTQYMKYIEDELKSLMQQISFRNKRRK